MPFFPRFHHPESTISTPYTAFPTDILRMLDQFENSVSGSSGGMQSSGSGNVRAFSPSFDVHETEHEYVLEGELPGLTDKKDVSIEFTDDKTILVHGRIERSHTIYRDSHGNVQTIEQGEEQKKIEGGSEDKQGRDNEEKEKEKEKDKKSGLKCWLSERSVGEFSRSFSFPTTVDVDRVKASLANGILKVAVPKLEKKVSRRIEVS